MSNQNGIGGFFKNLLSPAPAVSWDTIDEKQAFDIQKSQRALLVDVRTPAEFAETGIPQGAKALPVQAADFADQLKGFANNKLDKPVIFICRSGNRAKTAAQIAGQVGFEKIYVVQGGVPGPNGWVARGLPTEAA